jgi:hypothetical protein
MCVCRCIACAYHEHNKMNTYTHAYIHTHTNTYTHSNFQILAGVGDLWRQPALRPELPDDMPAEIAHLMQSCWATDAARRPTFQMLDMKVQMLEYVFVCVHVCVYMYC